MRWNERVNDQPGRFFAWNWKAREGVVSAQLADAQQELNKAIAAQQVFE